MSVLPGLLCLMLEWSSLCKERGWKGGEGRGGGEKGGRGGGEVGCGGGGCCNYFDLWRLVFVLFVLVLFLIGTKQLFLHTHKKNLKERNKSPVLKKKKKKSERTIQKSLKHDGVGG